MNNKFIPTILAATIVVAAIFAFAPVQNAVSVHTTIQGALGTSGDDLLASSQTITIDEVTVTDSNTGDVVTLTCTDNYVLLGLSADYVLIDDGDDILVEANGVGVFADEGDGGLGPVGVQILETAVSGTAATDVTITFTDADTGGDEDVVLRSTVLIDNGGTCTFTQTANP